MDGITENLGGRRVIRDIDGKFLKVELDSETAREMASSRKGSKALATEQRDSLLASRGLTADSDPALTALADIAIAGRSGAVSALRYFDILTGRVSPGQGITPPGEGETCAVCGHVNAMRLDLTPEAVVHLAMLMIEQAGDEGKEHVRRWLEDAENRESLSGQHEETTHSTEPVITG